MKVIQSILACTKNKKYINLCTSLHCTAVKVVSTQPLNRNTPLLWPVAEINPSYKFSFPVMNIGMDHEHLGGNEIKSSKRA